MRSVFLLAFLASACSGAPRDEARAAADSTSARDTALERQLLERVQADQAVRDSFVARLQSGQPVDSLTIARMNDVDRGNTAWLKGVVAKGGWPTRAQVGEKALEAAFLMVQHADLDTAFQARVLPALERAANAGTLPWQQVALLTDRIATHRGQPQVYGTQASITPNGKMVFAPIADSAHVDERRARVGLPPLAVYARVLDSVYTGQPPKP
jgi:hypothetical protein